MNVATPVRPRHSPCIGVCKLDEQSGFCLGCARTGDEIAAWASLDESGRNAIWQKLPDRLTALAVRIRLMPWTGDEILDWVAGTIMERRGTWVTGMPGAIAEFPCQPARSVSVSTGPDFIVGRADDALFRLRATDRLRAFAFDGDGPIVLGQARARLDESKPEHFTALGTDQNAIDADHRGQALFDFGLGRRFSRFCIRTGNAEFADRLNALAGLSWREVFAKAGAQILAESPTRVVASNLARIEVFSAIPPPGGRSPEGAHTHFLPQFFASGEEIPAALALPDYAAPVAVFYPGNPPE